MGSSVWLLLFLLILDIFVIRSLAQTCDTPLDFCWTCSTTRIYSNGSMYAQNLNRVLSSFTSNTTQNQADSGFYNSSLGEGLDRVNAIAMCRGDVALGACGSCLKKRTTNLLETCLYEREATLWAPQCIIRYSDNIISGVEIDNPRAYLANPNSVTKEYVQEYEKVRDSVLQYLSEKAASGDSQRKFASGHAVVASGEYQIYALVECTPDLDKQNCSSCLKKAMSDIPDHIGSTNGGRVLTPSCTLQYEGGIFYGATSSDSVVNITSSPITPPTITETPPLVPDAKGKKSKTKKVVVIIIVGVLAFVTMLFTGLCIFLKVKQQRENHGSEDLENDDDTEKFSFEDSLQYDFEIIRSATDDFSDANKLGQGGFGAVYKGMLLNGQHIAVKRLAKNSAQGASEFKNEVMLLAQLQHRNLVRLLGYCLEGEERLLVYEFMPNTSLDHFLFDPINHGHLDWETRYKIISGVVRGLLYLHEDSRLRIIHRDLKAGNILLGEDMNPKIADFGMARSFVMDQTQGNTRIIAGTYGYMAPEYVIHGRFSVKSDIFSFGVLVLEIVTGRKVGSFRNDDEDLLSYAWRSWRSDTMSNIIDPTLTIGSSEMMRCIHIGLLCVQENVNDRPTMASVASMFNSHSMALSVPLKPAYYSYYNTDSDISEPAQRSVYESKNEVSNITEPCPR